MIRVAAPPTVKPRPTRQEMRGPKKSPISESLHTPHPGGKDKEKKAPASVPDQLKEYMERNHPDISDDANMLEALDKLNDDAVKVVGEDLAASAAKLRTLYKQLFQTAEQSGKFSKKELESLTKSFNRIVNNTISAQRKHTKYQQSVEDLSDDLDAARQHYERTKYDYENLPLLETGLTYEDVEKAEEEFLVLQQQMDAAVRKMQQNANKTVEEVQDYEEVLDHEVTAIDEEVKATEEVKQKAEVTPEDRASEFTSQTKELIKFGLDAFNVSIAPHIPNDASIESDLEDALRQFEVAGKMVQGVAMTSRNPDVVGAVRAFGAFLMLPGACLRMAMKSNDNQPRTADWRDVLKSMNPFKPKEIKRAQDQAKTYLAAMRALDKKMVDIIDFLPTTGKGVKSMYDAIAVYDDAVRDVADVAARSAEEYPVLTVALNAFVEACTRHSKVFAKALR